MNNEQYVEIEQQIGYEFKNRLLLQQAFTRKSYTVETHNGDNNEVLEFIGDKVLDLIVVKALTEYYGNVNDRDEYECEYAEGKLTELKKHLVEGKMLAERIDELGFAEYLIMGKGDIAKNVQNEESVKEDLFEAIIGAVAIDSGWNIEAMQDAVEMMLHLDFYLENGFDDQNDYVSLIQQWHQKETGELPDYCFMDKHDYDIQRMYRLFRIANQRERMEAGEGDIVCELRIDEGEPFIGFGYSKSQARMLAAELAYNYLYDEGLLFTMADEVGEPTIEKAVSQLHELAQKGYIEFPEYYFEEKHDKNGNPMWLCECRVGGYEYYYYHTCSSKKEAKRLSAFDMLKYILLEDEGD